MPHCSTSTTTWFVRSMLCGRGSIDGADATRTVATCPGIAGTTFHCLAWCSVDGGGLQHICSSLPIRLCSATEPPFCTMLCRMAMHDDVVSSVCHGVTSIRPERKSPARAQPSACQSIRSGSFAASVDGFAVSALAPAAGGASLSGSSWARMEMMRREEMAQSDVETSWRLSHSLAAGIVSTRCEMPSMSTTQSGLRLSRVWHPVHEQPLCGPHRFVQYMKQYPQRHCAPSTTAPQWYDPSVPRTAGRPFALIATSACSKCSATKALLDDVL